MKQLVLELAARPEPTLDNYIVGRNAAALEALRSLVYAPEAGEVVYCYGETGAGKSHLVRAVSETWRRQGRSLRRFLASPTIESRTDDDKSLVLASRRAPSPRPALPATQAPVDAAPAVGEQATPAVEAPLQQEI